jgi:hypothetical protein
MMQNSKDVIKQMKYKELKYTVAKGMIILWKILVAVTPNSKHPNPAFSTYVFSFSILSISNT